ncbi:MAG: tRNA 4-thiouridine(8) synthase ThiI [Lachnospiraceae bacterium]|nr:tRNA 4-thiouridine(8) synthase ThiI [Lachnospiraceae bacterium]
MKKEMFCDFLIKYAEIGIKGKNRYLFEDALVARIKHAMTKVDGEFSIRKTPGRIFLRSESEFDFDEAIDALQHVFGIVGICPIVRLDIVDPETLAQKVTDYMREMYGAELCGTGITAQQAVEIMKENGFDADSASDAISDEVYGKLRWQEIYPSIKRNPAETIRFKMMVRRERKGYPKDSMVLNEDIGEALLNAFPGLKVDVHHPEKIVYVEIRDSIYLYSEIIPGPGGMPVGTGGHGMLLLSGGIDSPVAGYMVSKRGVTIDAVYFNAPPYTSERALQKVVDLATIISKYTGPINLHVINFTEIQMAIYEKCPHDELTIIMRRYMMRIAEHLAEECGAQGLITGESIGQVASQTFASLVCTNEVCTLPVIRPLIAFDKQDIVEISQKIGSYETSIQPYEDCCTIFVAKHPVTKPSRTVIRRHEAHLDDVIEDMLKTAYETDTVIRVGE